MYIQFIGVITLNKRKSWDGSRRDRSSIKKGRPLGQPFHISKIGIKIGLAAGTVATETSAHIAATS